MENVHQLKSETVSLESLLAKGRIARRGYLPTLPEEVEARISAHNQGMLDALANGTSYEGLTIMTKGQTEIVEVAFRVGAKSGDGQARFINLGIHDVHSGVQFVGSAARQNAENLIKFVDAGVREGTYRTQCETWIASQAGKFQKENEAA